MDMIQNVSTEPATGTQTRSYVHLLRAANDMFQAEEFDRLVIRQRGSKPIAATQRNSVIHLEATTPRSYGSFGVDFVRRGGKYSRPFITLAAYDAMTGGHGTTNTGPERIAKFTDAVRRSAVSIEMFHKASLVHDDIEDDDVFRYGQPTMHRRFGPAHAINVGDYMIGLGYRLVSRETPRSVWLCRRYTGFVGQRAYSFGRRPGSGTVVARCQ